MADNNGRGNLELNNNVSADNNGNNGSNNNTDNLTGNERRLANLVKFDSNQNREEAKKNGRLGGIKSGEARRKRKTASELLANILTQTMSDEQIEEILGNAAELLGDDKTAYNVMMVKALQVAMTGDIKAQSFIRDTVGDVVTQKTEVKAEITEADKQLIDSVRARLLG